MRCIASPARSIPRGWTCPGCRCCVTSGSTVCCPAGNMRSARRASAGPWSSCTARTPSSPCTGISVARPSSSGCGPSPPFARTTSRRTARPHRPSPCSCWTSASRCSPRPRRLRSGCRCTATASGPSSVFRRGAVRWSTAWSERADIPTRTSSRARGTSRARSSPGRRWRSARPSRGGTAWSATPTRSSCWSSSESRGCWSAPRRSRARPPPPGSCSPQTSSSSPPRTGRPTRPGPVRSVRTPGASSPATPGSPTGDGTR
jgi:hypothetical protein